MESQMQKSERDVTPSSAGFESRDDSEKRKSKRNAIIMFVIGVLVGAVVATGAFLIYVNVAGVGSSSGQSMQGPSGTSPEMPEGGTPPEMSEDGQPPELPEGEEGMDGQGQPPELPDGESGTPPEKPSEEQSDGSGQTGQSGRAGKRSSTSAKPGNKTESSNS